MSKHWTLLLQGFVTTGFCTYFLLRGDSSITPSDWILLGLAIMVIVTTTYMTLRRVDTRNRQALETLVKINRERNLEYSLQNDEGSCAATIAEVNDLLKNVKQTFSNANLNIEQLFETSSKLSASSAEIETSSDTQSQLLNQINHAMHNLSLGINNVTQHASNTLAITHETFSLCQEGETHVAEVIKGVGSVNESFQNIGSLVESLAQRSEEIAGIINVIGEIADQTNLLALNAAIEAARAGEQGRGFAVVADEVRSLAERTRKATVQVTDMVNAICTETKQVVEQMDSGKNAVTRCVELTERTSSTLHNILSKAADVESRTNEIASSAEEQNCSSAEIETTISQIADMSASINQSIHNSNEEIRKLLRMSADMVLTLREYKTTHVNELTSIRDCITLIRMNAILASNSSNARDTAQPINNIKEFDKKIEELWRSYIATPDYTENQILTKNFYDLWQKFKEARAITLTRSAEGDFAAARHNASTNAGPRFQAARLALEELIKHSRLS